MTAALVGATSLIGGDVLRMLLDDPYFDTVKILIRRPLEITHPKLEKKIVDFEDGDSLLVAMSNSDVVFCSIGTTQKKVKGDKVAYRKIDHDIPVNIARYCKMTGCEKFVLVSSVGANSKGSNFYLRIKGEVEEEVAAMGIRSVHIMRPSMLMGDRKEFRMAEKIITPVMKVLSFLIPPKYKAVHARLVAEKMIEASKKEGDGVYYYEGKRLNNG